eukprot:TRINITY_DN1296_c0_g3_i2.p1 TRINITY_DN1296_c0_g3~~TRINITY_DN1296_c0_g3_i2.p1  ORF type:complete len:140 (+),score=15.09 TRINITY_DN1296_c0_g3_i2:51-470(+)
MFRSFRRIGSQLRCHGTGDTEGNLSVNWVMHDGEVVTTKCKVGHSLLEVAHNHGLNIEGACEGVCACSTCHVIVKGEWFDKLPESTDEEEDMLDQAFMLKPTSRLGCQIKMTEELDGLTVDVPRYTRNMYVDGHVPHHH